MSPQGGTLLPRCPLLCYSLYLLPSSCNLPVPTPHPPLDTPSLSEKPFTTTWIMFLAMFMALPLHFTTSRCCCKPDAPAKGDKAVSAPGGITTRTFFLLMIPAVFDLVGTALAKCGLLFVNVSVYQLVRCSVIVICGTSCGGLSLPSCDDGYRDSCVYTVWSHLISSKYSRVLPAVLFARPPAKPY